MAVAVVAAWFALRRMAAPPPARPDPAAVQREILAVLDHGARAWDAGNLDDFLSDYLPDSGTTFVTKTGVLHGIDAIRGVYAARFAPGAQRDSLHFQNVEVDILGPDVVNTIAFYVLTRGDSITARGPTSLVMRRVSGRWRIVHDHSS
ncbi:MAG: SgcJ/EcaC family oxidoreductase [Gemmatimonadota bacterium]|nr:SgcJ/EcaC family oxidoreductase [Gemmatimonadota bacterium]HEU4988324.1 SgcJ/EcaC family oxidoreductase [Gemmatimonadaceae bacterium]